MDTEGLIPEFDPERERFSAGCRRQFPLWYVDAQERRRSRQWFWSAVSLAVAALLVAKALGA